MAKEKTKKYQEEKVDNNMEVFLKNLNINPNLVMLKVTLFVMYGATASLLPYLTIHMQSIGLTLEEIAIIYLALPFTTFLSPPVTGYLVDKFGKYKPVVVLSLILNAVFHHSLLLIPHMETPGEMPAAYVMRHPDTGQVEVWWSPCPSRECPEEEELDMVLATCQDHCMLKVKEESEPEKLITTTTPAPQDKGKQSMNNGKQTDTKDDCHCSTNIDPSLHFVLDGGKKKPKKSKKHKKAGPATGLGIGRKQTPMDSAFFLIDMHPFLGEPIEHLGMEMEPDENETVSDFKQMFGEELLMKAHVNVTALEDEDLRCGGLVVATNLTYNTLKQLAADCMLQKCHFRVGGPEVCPPDYKESDDRTFWIYFFLRFMGTTMLTAGVTMLDPIALTMIQAYGGEFGRERLFSTVGMAIFSPLTGLLIDHSSQHLGYTDYSAAFYTYDILLAISAVTVMLMPLGNKMPADHIVRDLLRIIRLPNVIMFIIFLFILGNFWGFIESFLFLYLKELGAPNYLLGITVTVGTVSSMPFLYGAEKITKKFGHVNIIVIAFFSHAARLMGYSFIESPWWCFPFEAIEALAVHLMWVAAATYCALLAPKNLLATLIGVLGMAHFSLGRGSGSFVGGLLIGTVGTRESFCVMGFLAIAGGVAYGLLHYFWLRKYELNATKYCEQSADCEHLHCEAGKEANKKQKDIPMVGAERLSLIIKLNHRGSLTSLDLATRSVLRGYPGGSAIQFHPQRRGSASKLDLLKSTLELDYEKNSLLDEKLMKNQQKRRNDVQNDKNKEVIPIITLKNPQTTTYEIQEIIISRAHSTPDVNEMDELKRLTSKVHTQRLLENLQGKRSNKRANLHKSLDEIENILVE